MLYENRINLMNKESLNKHLALKVMGYRPDLDMHGETFAYHTSEGDFVYLEDWNPTENLFDTMKVVAVRANVKAEYITMADLARVVDIGTDQYKPLALACSLSIAKATGWKE